MKRLLAVLAFAAIFLVTVTGCYRHATDAPPSESSPQQHSESYEESDADSDSGGVGYYYNDGGVKFGTDFDGGLYQNWETGELEFGFDF